MKANPSTVVGLSICNLVLQFTYEFSYNHVLVIHILFMKAVYTEKLLKFYQYLNKTVIKTTLQIVCLFKS